MGVMVVLEGAHSGREEGRCGKVDVGVGVDGEVVVVRGSL